ncbi:MAG: acetylxylan esterase [Blastocatellia bacterium]
MEMLRRRLYGILSEPKAPGKYPAVLEVPGAGIRPYNGRLDLAERGIITLQIGIHGLPVNLPQEVYDSLGRSGVASYWTYNLDNKDRYYYRRVYLGCVRANDFLVKHPKFDGVNLVVTGGSQGGALIVTAGLDSRVKALAAYYPALSDVTGYLNNRAGGWPHMFRQAGAGFAPHADKIETTKYYDVVNFARRVKAPGLYTWGFNDETCPPTFDVFCLQRHHGEERIDARAGNRSQSSAGTSRACEQLDRECGKRWIVKTERAQFMTKQLSLCIIIIALLALPLAAQQPRFAELDAVVQAELEQTKTPGAVVAIVQGDKIVYNKGFGVANIESKQPVTPDMLFRIGSMTKMYTAATLLTLAEEGKIDLHAPGLANTCRACRRVYPLRPRTSC